MERTVDYYEILQVAFDADKADITSSYRRLCKLYHPDLNHRPEAEELMKQINVAYYVLCDDIRRKAYNGTYAAEPGARAAEARRARETPRDGKEGAQAAVRYFDALLNGEYEKAYALLSYYDRQYVTPQSFCKWRTSVQGLYAMRAFSVQQEAAATRITLEDGRTVPAVKFYVSVTEKNKVTQAVEQYQVAKHAILEGGEWRVFLGYRDLNEIAKMFEDLSARHEQGEMAKHWETYCGDMCRELNMFSLKGMEKEAKRELYRYQRYGQPLAVACFVLHTDSREERISDALEAAAKTLAEALRETDISAYIGDGTFAVLFVEMRKRHLNAIARRLAGKIKKSLRAETGIDAVVDCAAAPYAGGTLKSYVERLAKDITRNAPRGRK